MAQLVHANQPEALSYHYYVDEESRAGTAILCVFEDLTGVGWRHLYKNGGWRTPQQPAVLQVQGRSGWQQS